MVCVGIYIFLQSFIDGPKIYFECIRRENATTILVLQLPLEKIYSDFFFKKKFLLSKWNHALKLSSKKFS